jgi:hypothetical protein
MRRPNKTGKERVVEGETKQGKSKAHVYYMRIQPLGTVSMEAVTILFFSIVVEEGGGSRMALNERGDHHQHHHHHLYDS